MDKLIGRTILSVTESSKGTLCLDGPHKPYWGTQVFVALKLDDWAQAAFYHEQDCCEDVWLEDKDGDWDDIIGNPILEASVVTEPQRDDRDYVDWTFYKIRTIKGSLTLRFCGDGGGYYSTDVGFKIIEMPAEQT